MQEYEVTTPQGIRLTMLLEEKTAKERGLKPVERKGAAPLHKARKPRNKAADVAPTSED